MPKQKDLKRVVRTRMKKTGESYTTARSQILKKSAEPPPDYAALSGVSETAIRKQTGRPWSDWVKLLDDFDAPSKPHREIAEYVYAQGGISGWWSQSITVGYERIRGLRERGQRRGGLWEANKSRTFAAPVAVLFEAFTSAAKRRRWLDAKITIRKATPPKYIHITWPDGTSVDIGFIVKGDNKTAVAVQHAKLPSKEEAARMKEYWSARFDALDAMVANLKKGAAAPG